MIATARLPRSAIAVVYTVWTRFQPAEQPPIGSLISPIRMLGVDAVLGVIESLGAAGRLSEIALLELLAQHSSRLKAIDRRAEEEI